MTDEAIVDDVAPDAEETPSVESVEDDAIQPEKGDGEGGEGEQSEPDPWADYEEVEILGKAYKVPKDIKDGFLMQADYTRKTQEVAEQRRAVEAAQKAHTEGLKAAQAYLDDLGEIRYLDKQIDTYAKVNWNEFRAQNPELADQHWFNYQQLKDQRGNIANRVVQRQNDETSKAQREADERQEKGFRELSDPVKGIKGWGPDLAGKLVAFAQSEGLTDADISAFENNPRVIKLVHKAWLAKGITEKAKAAAAAAQTKADSPPIEPVKQVTKARSGPPPSAGPSDSDDGDTWLRKRNAQIAARNRRK